MISLHMPVNRGKIVNQDGQFDINGIIVRGGEYVAVKVTGKPNGEELSGGIEMDLPSLTNFCKRILLEAGTLPKWLFIGVIVDASHSQLTTYFSPSKEKFFSDLYNYIKENLASNVPMADTESVVKNFFDNNRDYLFSYQVIPIDSLITGLTSGRMEQTDIRF